MCLDLSLKSFPFCGKIQLRLSWGFGHVFSYTYIHMVKVKKTIHLNLLISFRHLELERLCLRSKTTNVLNFAI